MPVKPEQITADVQLGLEGQTRIRQLHKYFTALSRKAARRPTKAQLTARMLGDLVARMPRLTYDDRESDLGCRIAPYFDLIYELWEEARTVADGEKPKLEKKMSEAFMLKITLVEIEREIFHALNPSK